jgi:hypothetical protein
LKACVRIIPSWGWNEGFPVSQGGGKIAKLEDKIAIVYFIKLAKA